MTVADQRPGSPDGTDTLTNIQNLRFSDSAIKIAAAVPIAIAKVQRAAPVAAQKSAFAMAPGSMPISKWSNCAQMAKAGYRFELQNRDGQKMWASCSAEVPQSPVDWTSGPAQFKMVRQPAAVHPQGLPAPLHP